MRRVRIAGLSTYVPPRVLTNADLEKLVETNDEWILQRTGIRERHIVSDGMATSDMAKEAALGAIAQAGITPADIGFIVVGTTTPDTIFPSTACVLQDKIGATRSWGFDLGAACSGFTYALTVGMQMVATGAHDHALVVGADTMSSIIDYRDRTTCILFGDGAGAAVLSPAGEDEPAIIDFAHEIDGSGGPALCMPAGGSRMPASHETIDARQHYVKQDGQTVFKFAVRKTEEISRRVLERNGLEPSEVDLFVSHQANRRIIKAAAERLGLPDEKVVINLERFGNTTGATIPLALARCGRRQEAETGRPGAARLGRRRLHRGRSSAPLGLLSSLRLKPEATFQADAAGSARPERRSDLVDQQLRVVAHRVLDDDHRMVLGALEPDPCRVLGIRGDDVGAHGLHDPERVVDRRRRHHGELQLGQYRPGRIADRRLIADHHDQGREAIDVGWPSSAARLAPAIRTGAKLILIRHSAAILVQVGVRHGSTRV